MRKLRFLAGALTVLALLALPAAAAPIPVATNQTYGTQDATHQRLDLYCPPATLAPPNGFPVVITLHPGGWNSGSRNGPYALSEVQALLNDNLCAANADYRLSPAFTWPAPEVDVWLLAGWLKNNAAAYHLDVTRLGAWGISAGSQIALISSEHFPAGIIKAVASIEGPTDLNDPNFGPAVAADIAAEFPTQANKDDGSAIRTASATPPVFVFCSTQDTAVPAVSQCDPFTAALAAAGAPYQYVLGTGAHADQASLVAQNIYGQSADWLAQHL